MDPSVFLYPELIKLFDTLALHFYSIDIYMHSAYICIQAKCICEGRQLDDFVV